MPGLPDKYYDPPMGGGDDINLPFIIGISSSLSFMLLIVLVLAIYYIFFNESLLSSEYQGNTLNIPDSFSNLEDDLENESLYLDKLSNDDQFYYRMGKKFQMTHKPSLTPMGQALDLNTELSIRNRGIHVFYFDSYVDQLTELLDDDDTVNDENTPLIDNRLGSSEYGTYIRNDIPFLVEDKTDISFLTGNPSSTALNLPLPTKNRHNETVYFEVKLFEFDPATTKISVGLSTKPNPNFRLPGEFYYSFGLESSGHLKINRPLYLEEDIPVLTPQLIQGDVIGVGFKSLSGTIFITHNGKKKADIIKNLKTDLYPCIGCVGGRSKVQVNLGQSGFVFIEANVKKLGFCESNNEGNLGAPPNYDRVIKKEHKQDTATEVSTSSSSDIILEQGEALPPHYPVEEDTFFGPQALITRHQKNNNEITEIPSNPPSYRSNSSSSEKFVKILSTKLNQQQQIPDQLLNLNERYYEHSTSQFDQNENSNSNTGLALSDQNLQKLLAIDETRSDLEDSKQRAQDKETQSEPVSAEGSSSPDANTSSLVLDSTSKDPLKAKKKKKKSTKKARKNRKP